MRFLDADVKRLLASVSAIRGGGPIFCLVSIVAGGRELNTCARFAGTHGGVLDLHTETFLNLHTVFPNRVAEEMFFFGISKCTNIRNLSTLPGAKPRHAQHTRTPHRTHHYSHTTTTHTTVHAHITTTTHTHCTHIPHTRIAWTRP